MDTGNADDERNFPLLAIDIVKNVLSRADSPDKLSEYITAKMRELTGAQTAVMVEYTHSDSTSTCCRTIAVSLERNLSAAESDRVDRLISVVHELDHTTFWHDDQKEKDNAILVPLRVGDSRVGALMLFNIPDDYRYESAVNLFDMLATIIALVLRDSMMLERQEHLIKLRTDELRASEERFRAIFESLPMGIHIYRIEPDGRLIFKGGNPAADAITGFDSSSAIGKTIEDAFPALVDTDVPDRYRAAAIGGISSHWSEVPYIYGGISGVFEVWVFQTMPRQATVAFLDITERKQAEEERRRLEAQIQHAQKLESLGVLASGIAHDFNNLLTGILGNADLALMELPPVSPARRSLQEIEIAAHRAADLCRQMLAYSGRGKFVVETIDVNELIDEMSHLLDISISKKALLRYNLADNLPAIEADATQIRQVLMNLIINASEAIGNKSGVISVSTGAMDCDRAYLRSTFFDDDLPEGVYVYFEVSDTGCGMDETTRNKIFDPFFTTKFTGRGLGLAAVLGIVRGHGGTIKVYSEPNRGTTFKALFPAVDLPAASHAKVQNYLEHWRGSGTVLLADDEETVRVVGSLMLERIGFEVVTADNGRDAVEKFKQLGDKLAFVLLDLTMPHMDGEEAFREFRQINDRVPVILSSGYNEQDVVERFAGKGLAGFIQKPYEYDALVRAIRNILG